MDEENIFVNEDDLKKNLEAFICKNDGRVIVNGYYKSTELLLMDRIPYILRDDSILWSVPISNVTVEEFINTFPECKDNGICIQRVPMAGGPGRKVVRAAIKASVSILSIKYPLIGVPLTMAQTIGELIESLSPYYEAKDITPKQQLDALINDNEYVNKAVIKDITNYDDYHAIRFIETLGFFWDSKANCYRINDIDKARAKSIIDHWDDGDK